MLPGEGKVFSQHPQTGCRVLPQPREETVREGVGETGPASGAVRESPTGNLGQSENTGAGRKPTLLMATYSF